MRQLGKWKEGGGRWECVMKVGDREGGEIEEGKRELMKKMRESEGGGKC